MKEETPLFSLIVRTKDRPELVKHALRSIAAQTYRPIEVVLVNDGGCDLETDEMKGILGDISLNYIRLENNTGRAHAGNTGIKNAKGEYIGFLDDDDELYPVHAETLVSFLERSEFRIAYSDAFFVYKECDAASGELREVGRELAFSQDFDYGMLVFENYIPFMCVAFDRNALVGSDGFDGDLDLYEDWDLLIRLGSKYQFHHIRRATALYNQWSTELQISQGNKDRDFIRESYLRVLSRHIREITPDRIYGYVASSAHTNLLIKELKREDAEYGKRAARIKNLEAVIKEKDSLLCSLEAAMKERDARIENMDVSLKEKERRMTIIESALQEKEAYIQFVHSGHGWRLLTKYFRLRDKLLPVGTKRRRLVKWLFRTLTNPQEVPAALKKTEVTAGSLPAEKQPEQELADEGLGPNASAQRVTDQNPPAEPARGDYFSFLFEMNTGKGDYVSPSQPVIPETDVKLIAFYLPQFHPIKENDEWWGKGFTEWANVSKAVPQFIGHYQPRLPGELGFYDLRVPEIQKRQIELAVQYGIHGFCVHFYWFNGRTLLERPLQEFAESFDFPFCINWANENWTRRWDGLDNEILIAQKHSPEDDIEFIRHISRYLRNKNYIKINSKPLLLLYRPASLPDPKATGERWRKWCLDNGIGEIYLAAVHSFDELDPRTMGFDAVVEFPPLAFPFKDVSHQFNIVNPDYKGVISDYKDAAAFFANCNKPPYTKFRGIIPGWDNEARIPGRGKVLANSTPRAFKHWLKTLCYFTGNNLGPDERLIFMNAWNEWGEGAYLEPDRRYGYAYLQAVAEALTEYSAEKKQKKIIYVCHDAHFHGAQLLSLSIVKMLRLKFHYEVHCVLKSGGKLEPSFAEYAEIYNLERDCKTPQEKEKLAEHFFNQGIREAIFNSVASGDLTGLFQEKGIKTVTLVHELPGIITQMGIEENARSLAAYSSKIVFPSDFVAERFKTIADMDEGKTVILPQGLYKDNGYKKRKHEARKTLRENFSLPENAAIILGVGYGDYRKGFDLFIEVAKRVTQEIADVYFMWVGDIHDEMGRILDSEVRSHKKIILQSARDDVSLFYAGADIYLLTSREDPFPAVVLEAMDVGLPVIAFDDAGGFRDIVNENTGALVPYLDLTAMARGIVDLLNDAHKRELCERNNQKLIEESFNFTDYMYRLLAISGHEYKKVSVIVPNYNYEKYLKMRMESVLNQSYPIYEIIFLDDASTDGSARIAQGYLEEGSSVKFIKNEVNSGSVFNQWVKGLRIARGDYLWIAEADDICEGTFLEELISRFEKDKDVVLAYCQSKQIDEDGESLRKIILIIRMISIEKSGSKII